VPPSESDVAHPQTIAAHRFVEDILQLTKETDDLELKIDLGEWLARFLFSNACGIYRLDDIEIELARAWKPSLHARQVVDGSRELHVISHVLPHGGHTRLMMALMSASKRQCDVLVTRPASADAVSAVLGVTVAECQIVCDGPVARQLEQIFSVAARYQRIVLHLHPDDVIAVTALRALKEADPSIELGLVNHSDHTFSVGIGLANVIFELSTFGWNLRGERHSEGKSTFIGIPIAQAAPQNAIDDRQASTVLTAGSAYKFRPSSGQSLPRVLAKLLDSTAGATLVVIGPTWRDPWWRPLRKYGNRVTVLPRIPHRDYLVHLQTCAVFVDSHPITGGTAFTEALMMGAPVAGLYGESYGYGLADQLRSLEESDFIRDTQLLLAQDVGALQRQGEIRQMAHQFHSPSAVRHRLEQGFQGQGILSPPAELSACPPSSSFERRWQLQGKILPAGFRHAAQTRIAGHVIPRLVRHFPLTASSALGVSARALHARLRR